MWFKDIFSKNKTNNKSNNSQSNIDSNNSEIKVKNGQVINNINSSYLIHVTNEINKLYNKKTKFLDNYFKCSNCKNKLNLFIDSCNKTINELTSKQKEEFVKISPYFQDYSLAINELRYNIKLVQEYKHLVYCDKHSCKSYKYKILLEQIESLEKIKIIENKN